MMNVRRFSFYWISRKWTFGQTSGHRVRKLEPCPCNTKEEGRCMTIAVFEDVLYDFLCVNGRKRFLKKTG